MAKERQVMSLFFVCLIIINLYPHCATASKVKLFKKLVKAKLLKGIGKGVTKVIIPLVIPIPIPKKMPMFMTTMSTIPIMNQNSYPIGYDNSLLSFGNSGANYGYKSDSNYGKPSDNMILFPQSMSLN